MFSDLGRSISKVSYAFILYLFEIAYLMSPHYNTNLSLFIYGDNFDRTHTQHLNEAEREIKSWHWL